jgi:acetyl esterase/lipase
MFEHERTCTPGIKYGEAGGEELFLDLYLPDRGDEATDPLPCVIYIHGGGWVQGSRSGPSGVVFAIEMSGEGLAVASVDYRLAPAHRAPAAIEDCKLAVRWVRANAAKYGIDPNRLVAMGNSAGGHLAAMMALTQPKDGFDVGELTEHSSAVMAAVNLCGIADVEERLETGTENSWAETWLPKVGEWRELARRCSPLTYAHAGAPPMLIVHGEADPYVPHHQSLRLHRALRKAGADSELVSIPGADHFLSVTGSVAAQRRIREVRREFFAKLGLTSEAPAAARA